MTKIIGLALIALGIAAFVWQGFTYTYKKKEKVLDIGPLQATVEKEKTIPLSPVLGGICLVGGIFMVVAGRKKA